MSKSNLINRKTYHNTSLLTFGNSYCRYNLNLLKILIQATINANEKIKEDEKDSYFYQKIKQEWLDLWKDETELKNNYFNESTKKDFFNFAFHIPIWKGDYNLTSLAIEVWEEYDKTKKIEEFNLFFDRFLLNYIVTFRNKSYNPFLIVLNELKNENKNKKDEEKVIVNNSKLREIFEKKFEYENFPLWKSRIFYLLISSSSYFEKENEYSLELKIDLKKIKELID